MGSDEILSDFYRNINELCKCHNGFSGKGGFIHSPRPRGAKGAAGGNYWNRVAFAIADTTCAKPISGWISGPEEMQYVGVGFGIHRKKRVASDSLTEDETLSWITEEGVGFILKYDDGSRGEMPVAFINVQVKKFDNINKTRIEVGRLLVDPKFRRMGFGSTLALNVLEIVSNAKQSIPQLKNVYIYARVVKSNDKGQKLVKRLPLVPTNRYHGRFELLNPITTNIETWFRFVEVGNIAALLKTRKQDEGVDINALAFKCGVSRSAISMIESGKRLPSVELLCRLYHSFAFSSVEDKLSFLLASVGDSMEFSLDKKVSIKDVGSSNRDKDLWVIADELAEVRDEQIFSDSVNALNNGKCRFYFVPLDYYNVYGRRVIHAIAEKISQDVIQAGLLKVYSAPVALCNLRIAIANPKEPDAFDSVTIGGDGYDRIPLPEDRAKTLFKSISLQVSSVEFSGPVDREDMAGVSFARLFPGRD